MKYLLFDIGSSYIKFAIADIQTKKIINTKRINMLKNMSTNENRYEIDSEALFHFIKNEIDSYIDSYEPQGILFSTQMHSYVIGNDCMFSPVITWRDERCKLTVEMKEKLSSNTTGFELKERHPIIKLYHNISNNEYPFANTFYTLGSYIIYRLTGVNVCHITNSASTGLVNIYEKRWDVNSINNINAGKFNFPKIVTKLSVCGTYRGINVFPDIGDHAATVLGVTEKEDDIVITVGTAGLIAVIDENLPHSETRPFFNDKYINVICKLPGGRNLDVLWNFCMSVLDMGESNMSKSDFINNVCAMLTTKDLPPAELSLYSNKMSCLSFFSSIFDELAKIYAEHINNIKRKGDIVTSGGAIAENMFFKERIEEYTKRTVRQCKTKDPEIDGLMKLCDFIEWSNEKCME